MGTSGLLSDGLIKLKIQNASAGLGDRDGTGGDLVFVGGEGC